MFVFPVVVHASLKPHHHLTKAENAQFIPSHFFITVAVFSIVYIVTFQHPMLKWSLDVSRDLSCGLVMLLASLRLSPGTFSVAPPQ